MKAQRFSREVLPAPGLVLLLSHYLMTNYSDIKLIQSCSDHTSNTRVLNNSSLQRLRLCYWQIFNMLNLMFRSIPLWQNHWSTQNWTGGNYQDDFFNALPGEEAASIATMPWISTFGLWGFLTEYLYPNQSNNTQPTLPKHGLMTNNLSPVSMLITTAYQHWWAFIEAQIGLGWKGS